MTALLTKKHLSRRTLLKGAGVALALPFLDAMVPAATVLGQTAAARKLRFGFFYLPHGAVMNIASFPAGDQWTPEGFRGKLQAQDDHDAARPVQEVRDVVRGYQE
jgi:hypothetical protein